MSSYWLRMGAAAVLFAIYFHVLKGVPTWRQFAGAALASVAGALLWVTP